jgi:hypothetical protein
MKFDLMAGHARNTACILFLGMSSFVTSAAYAASDACCVTEFPSCGCQLMDNGDWKKQWGLAATPVAGSPEAIRLRAAQQKYGAAMKAFAAATKEFQAAAKVQPAKK